MLFISHRRKLGLSKPIKGFFNVTEDFNYRITEITKNYLPSRESRIWLAIAYAYNNPSALIGIRTQRIIVYCRLSCQADSLSL